jgi:hypothetical protein
MLLELEELEDKTILMVQIIIGQVEAEAEVMMLVLEETEV